MSDEQVLAESDNPKNLIILGAVVVCVVGLLVIIIGVNEYFKFAVRDEITAKQLQPVSPLRRELSAREQAHLTKYQWVDKNAQVVRIPVDRAMELTVRDWASRPETIAPPAPPQPAPTPEPEKAPGKPAPKKTK